MDGPLDLHPQSGQRALRAAGFYEIFTKHARREAETLGICDSKGEKLLYENNGENGRPEEFNNSPENDRKLLQDILLNSLDVGIVKWKSKLIRIETLESGILNLNFSDRIECAFNVVVGADGAWSKVRSQLTTQNPVYSGVGGQECYIDSTSLQKSTLAERMGKTCA